MKMIGRVLSWVAAASAVVCAITLVMWVRSYFITENWSVATSEGREYQVFSHGGGIYVTGITGWSNPHGFAYRAAAPSSWDRWGDESLLVLQKTPPWRLAYITGSLRDDGIYPCWLLVVPYCLPVGMLAVGPVLGLLWRWRQRGLFGTPGKTAVEG